MQRIIIIGSTGSGKSTLAEKISAQLGFPMVELDELNHLPNWETRTDEEFRQLTDTATQQAKWVATGNYTYVSDLTWARADTLIWLDYPFRINFWRLLQRTSFNLRNKKTVCNGNMETWGTIFSPSGIIIWLCKTYLKNKRRFNKAFQNQTQWPNLKFIHLTTPQQTQDWLEEIQ